MAYADVKAKKWDWDRFIQARNRRMPQKKAWVKRTLYRWIDKALQQVDAGLRQNSVLLLDGAGLQVAHEEAQHGCKSITSGLHAWPAPEEIPAECG
jgi:asparagine synthetase A